MAHTSGKVMVIADLHLDRWLTVRRDPLAGLAPGTLSSLDALIIAGDLSDKPKTRWPNVLKHLSGYIDLRRVWVVPGNHDYYHHSVDDDARLALICQTEGANFAQKRLIFIGDTRYLCCTLWTDFALQGSVEIGMRDAAHQLNDYRYIRLAGAGHRRIRPVDIVRVHADHRSWLETHLAKAFGGDTIVVTHHAPLPACIPEGFTAAPAYASDLSDMIDRYKPKQWLFGHTHVQMDIQRGGTFVRNVSLGYDEHIAKGTEVAIFEKGLV
ncbi:MULTISPECIES: metallophosphoesterase [unclassified Yoonia]|uniref:metallophosphoesterase n=1 Tax=unclassified Yoonia TaxID=2629118 RepID=UPI002AFFA4E6|nr:MULTISPECIES: metallophosphoesterase [unclassified Yoonia]